MKPKLVSKPRNDNEDALTLVAAWTRPVTKDKSVEELWLVSDSRLTGGQQWDSAPKLFTLPRTDAAIAFVGSTFYAYPVIEQLRSAIAIYPKSASRALDISFSVRLIVAILNDLLSRLGRLPSSGEPSIGLNSFKLILCGYSWVFRAFGIWFITYDVKNQRFQYKKIRRQSGRLLAIAGLNPEMDSNGKYGSGSSGMAQFKYYLRQRGKKMSSQLNLEPFEFVRDMCRDNQSLTDDIGGAPQVLKLYQHMNVLPYSVFWPNRASGIRTYLGRQLLDFERPAYLVLDPDKLETIPIQEAVTFQGTGRSLIWSGSLPVPDEGKDLGVDFP